MTPVIGFDHSFGDRPLRDYGSMRPSRFDLLTSSFVALIVMLGLLVTVLFLIWLCLSIEQPPLSLSPSAVVSSASAASGQHDFELPAAEEVVELVSPTLSEVLEEVSEVSSMVAGSALNTTTSTFGGPGTGPSGPRASPPGDPNIVSRDERWELRFVAANRAAYARQLDFHGIELGVFGGGVEGLDFASKLGTSPIARHLEDPSGENRLYFSWLRPSPLASYEAEILKQAEITTQGRQILKFVPPELENALAVMELEYAQSHGVTSMTAIAKTVFQSKSAEGGFQFTVAAQRYKRR